ncbi:hypothetical protein [Burkholderia cenocepacia]|uniref:hypothetical protein n=1 Tax=Burkholderia cenocepacia TaxID=95486 RepID=UPI0007610BD3|nr:hypothetical protein [Burkholderia cenocepacia]KWU19133.1 hypothetical protein AS149_12865 [Burkholderia cenocepacia]
MNKNQFKELQHRADRPVRLSASLLVNLEPRTLIYGATSKRDTFHVYLDEAKIQLVTYDGDGFLRKYQTELELEAADYEPGKYAYPEACDFEFAALLQQAGVDVNYLAYQDRAPAVFHGARLSELAQVPESHVAARIRITAGEIDLPEESVFRKDADKRSALTREMHMLVNASLERLNRLHRYRGQNVRSELDEIPARVQQFVRLAAAELSEYEMPDKVRNRILKELYQQVYG